MRGNIVNEADRTTTEVPANEAPQGISDAARAQEAAGQQERCHVTGVQGWIDSSLWQRSLCHVLYKPVSPTSSSWTPRADAYQQIHTRHAPTSHTGCSQEHTDTEVLCYFSRGVCVTVIKKPLTPPRESHSSNLNSPLQALSTPLNHARGCASPPR